MITGNQFRDMVISGANSIENQKNAINALNVFPVPDGDTGTNMSLTIGSAAKALRDAEGKGIGDAANAAASALLKGARGNSGVILSLLFRGIAKGLAGLETADSAALAKAFSEGVTAAYGAVMKPTEGTILTVARVAAEQTQEYAATAGARDTFEHYLKCAKETLDKTPEMLPVLKQAGVVDAGGKGLVVILDGMLAALDGKPVEAGEAPEEPAEETDFSKFNIFETEEEIVFAYCTEYIVTKEPSAKKRDSSDLRKYLESIGDCVVVVDDGEIIKVHVHTNHPGRAFEEALRYGSLINMKVENMREQFKDKKKEEPVIDKKYGFVAVAAGEGLANLFRDMNADRVVEGGQTMNPSTDDILDAISATTAENVFVLPNNKNIIMAAEQAAELSDRNVIVIPSKTVPQGITALLNFDDTLEPDAAAEQMTAALPTVRTAQVTYAARNSEFDGKKIKKGQLLGLTENKVTCVEDDIDTLIRNLIGKMLEEGGEFINVYYGQDASEQDAAAVSAIIKELAPEAEVITLPGGQPVYRYIISIE